jgi:hypothetical protein
MVAGRSPAVKDFNLRPCILTYSFNVAWVEALNAIWT